MSGYEIYIFLQKKLLNYLQTLETLIRCRILRHLIWVCTVCQLPFCGSPDYNGLRILWYISGTANYYHMQLVRGKTVRLDPNSPFTVREVGNFIIITTPQGITLEWDRGTRVYVKLKSDQQGQVLAFVA